MSVGLYSEEYYLDIFKDLRTDKTLFSIIHKLDFVELYSIHKNYK